MESRRKNIEDSCTVMERLLRWIGLAGVPPVPFVGPAGGRFHNPPAQHLEIVLAVQGECPDLKVGDVLHPLTAPVVSVHNVHHGNHSDWHDGFEGWCLFLDLTGVSEFSDLAQRPLAWSFPLDPGETVPSPEGPETSRVLAAFCKLSQRCHQIGGGPPSYFAPQPVYLESPAIDRAGQHLVRAAAGELLAVLLDIGEARRGRHGRLPLPVQAMLDYLAIHFRDAELDLPRLAREAGLSPSHAGRLFRQHLGVSPLQHLQQLRLEHGRHLLARTDWRINEIAREIGIPDPLYFSRLFSRAYRVSPREWRRTQASLGARS